MSKSVAAGLLALILLAAYANHFQNSFHFDDAHTIVNNAAIQSVRSIPHFFTDATTFSSLPSNQSYRPLVSTLLGIDYALGHGRPFWFHLSIFVLLLALVFLIVILIYRLTDNVWIAFGAAALYGLHPANADTVNYIIASAEIISTLGIVASFALYLAYPRLRSSYIYALPAAIAILAKPPAAIFAVLFAVYRFLFPCSRRPAGDGHASHSEAATTSPRSELSWFAEAAPTFMICIGALLFVQWMTPHTWVAGARNAHDYLLTQPYVALLYFKTFFWPNDLSADYDLNSITTTSDPRFWIGIVFVALLSMISILLARSVKTRVIGFGLLWFLVCLLPTSLFPLAEVMNDHRTFLPYIGLIISIAGAGVFFVQRRILQRSSARIAFSLIILFILSVNAFATFQRNKVWKTEETLWHDVTIKSPNNSRGLMNYGNTLMAKGDYAGALDYFHRALALAPQYSVLFINLGVAEDATKQDTLAEQHFKEALRLAPSSPDSYTFYARYLLAHDRVPEAEARLRTALALSPNETMARELLSRIEKEQTNSTESAEDYLNRSLELYRAGRFEEAIAACHAAIKLRPSYAEAWNNICAANNKLGRYEEAAAACEIALRYKPDFDLARNNLNCAKEHCR